MQTQHKEELDVRDKGGRPAAMAAPGQAPAVQMIQTGGHAPCLMVWLTLFRVPTLPQSKVDR